MSRKPHFDNLKLDSEYQSMKPHYSSNEYAALEQDILKNGCKNPIVVSCRIILDGYKRYSICKKHHIKCPIKSFNSSYREERTAWVCRNELTRPELSKGYRKYFLGSLYIAQKAIFRKKYPAQNQSTPNSEKRPPVEQPNVQRNYTAAVLGKEYDLCETSFYKYSVYATNINKIKAKSPIVAQQILADKALVSLNTISFLGTLQSSELLKLESLFLSPNSLRIQMTDIEQLLYHKHQTSPKPAVKDISPAIKQIPQYDPDAEISSLTLTIPSWINSIQRTTDRTDFANITGSANRKLQLQLLHLQSAILTLYDIIKENSHE